MSVMPLIDKGISPLGIVTSQGVESCNNALLVVRSKGIISGILLKLQREHDLMETLYKQGIKQQSTGEEVVKWVVQKVLASFTLDHTGRPYQYPYKCKILSSSANGVVAYVGRSVGLITKGFEVEITQHGLKCACRGDLVEGHACQHAAFTWSTHQREIKLANESRPAHSKFVPPCPLLDIRKAIYYHESFHLAEFLKSVEKPSIVPSFDMEQAVHHLLMPPSNDRVSSLSRRLRRLRENEKTTVAKRQASLARSKAIAEAFFLPSIFEGESSGCESLPPRKRPKVDEVLKVEVRPAAVRATRNREVSAAIDVVVEETVIVAPLPTPIAAATRLSREECNRLYLALMAKYRIGEVSIVAVPPHVDVGQHRHAVFDASISSSRHIGPNNVDDGAFPVEFGCLGAHPPSMQWVGVWNIGLVFPAVDGLPAIAPLSSVLAKPPKIDRFYQGVVTHINDDGTVGVLFRDGDKYNAIGRERVFLRDVAQEAKNNLKSYNHTSSLAYLREEFMKLGNQLTAARNGVFEVPPKSGPTQQLKVWR